MVYLYLCGVVPYVCNTMKLLYTVFDASFKDRASNRVVQVDYIEGGESIGSFAPFGLVVPESVPAGQYDWKTLAGLGAFYRIE